MSVLDSFSIAYCSLMGLQLLVQHYLKPHNLFIPSVLFQFFCDCSTGAISNLFVLIMHYVLRLVDERTHLHLSYIHITLLTGI